MIREENVILLYANEDEVKYVNHKPRLYIGLSSRYLSMVSTIQTIQHAKEVILFGCAGWKGKRKDVKFNQLYHWTQSNNVVDMESQKVYNLCRKYGVKFTSIRYIIDLDRDKVMPPGINWLWRKFQHRRMQLKFNKYLEGLK